MSTTTPSTEGGLRVFLSSASEDLGDHRRAVAVRLEELGHHVEQMDGWGAQGPPVVETLEGKVRGCDLFVLLVAGCYGESPTEEIGHGRSYTHLEFDTALRAGVEVRAFLGDSRQDFGVSDAQRAVPGTREFDLFSKRSRRLHEFVGEIEHQSLTNVMNARNPPAGYRLMLT